MTDVEKRLLLNQREIMYALKMYTITNVPPSVTTGLGECCIETNKILNKKEYNIKELLNEND